MRHFVLVPLVLALAACGGSSKAATSPPSTAAPTTTAAPITKAAYVTRANAICKVMNQQIDALGQAPDDPVALAAMGTRSNVIIDTALRRLRALPMPASDAAQLHSIYAKVDRLLVDGRQLVVALRARDRVAATRLSNAMDADETAANDASNAYGLTVCGS